LGEGLAAALHYLAHDDAVRVVVLRGRGPSFCAGADIGAMKASAGATFEQNLAEAQKLGGMFGALADFPKPVIGRIHGGVYGGGVGLCCACDLAIASEDARFGLTEVRLGILPALSSPYLIRRIGDRQARELMLTGERFGADVARRAGIVNDVAPAAELDARVDARARDLMQGAPQARKRRKMLVALWADSTWDE